MAIRHKLAIGFGLLFIFMLAALWLLLKLQLAQTLDRQSGTLGQILARQTADSVTELVLANDSLGLNVVLAQLAREPGVASVSVSDVDGTVLASASLAGEPASDERYYQAPVTLQDAVAGWITLVLDHDRLGSPMLRPHMVFYLVMVLSLLAVAALAWYLATRILQPIRILLTEPQLVETASDPLLADLQDRFLAQAQRVDELETLVESTALPDPAEFSNLSLRAERRMSTFLLVEAVNIHTAIELLHPAALSTLLQEYQFYLRQAARLYSGSVLSVEGHRLLVSFDIRHCQEEHAFNAICCGQLFLKLMEKVAQAHKSNQNQSLDFRVLVHSGDAYYSPQWKKKRPGVQTEREESVIGKPVDLAAALLHQAPAGKLLVTELSLELAGGLQRFDQSASHEIAGSANSPTLPVCILSASDGNHTELLLKQTEHLFGNRHKPEPT